MTTTKQLDSLEGIAVELLRWAQPSPDTQTAAQLEKIETIALNLLWWVRVQREQHDEQQPDGASPIGGMP